ncbi:MAG TPA: MBL fold metallo-hydrolase [Candidatus Sulfotelmatobacter sp.]|nr:MBL fold metallo-hydrolase [Candidatus Sulfotelmatobacter sp.]
MSPKFLEKQSSRREMLRNFSGFAGSALLAQLFPATLLSGVPSLQQQAATAPADRLTAMRAQMGATPIQAQPLAENLKLLSGPGGNVVVLNGPDGKIVVDTFLLPAWPKLKEALDGLGNAPVKTVIDTHWHFDHTDNNGNLHAAGATVLAHENTKSRMAEPHDSALLGLHIPPSPADALPQQTFRSSQKLEANGEMLMLQYFQPAHTDTDIYIHFQKANVIHMGDTFFNRCYPVIDTSTGGKINGMIVAADKVLPLADKNTKIVPGHGPLGNKADLTRFRDMLVVARDRVQKLKTAGKSAEEIAAGKPLADLDAVWGHGMLSSDLFVQMICSAL